MYVFCNYLYINYVGKSETGLGDFFYDVITNIAQHN